MPKSNIELYWGMIQSGKVKASKKLIQQYEKIIADMKSPQVVEVLNAKGELEKRTFYFDIEYAQRPIRFIESFCKHSKGKWAGKPLILEPFQKAKFEALFGFVDSETKLRRYTECLTIEGRKNGKSEETSAIGNYMLIGDGEAGAQVVSLASKKDQAKIVFNEAKNMVVQSPMLARYIKRRKSDLYVPTTFSTFEPLASDSDTLDGLNVSCGIIDELHSIKDRNIYDVVKQSMTTREQPLLYMISTGGFHRDGIYDEMYEYATKVLNGTVYDPRFLCFIYELDSESEWTDFNMWEKANPGLGVIKSVQTLSEHVQRAKDDAGFKATVLMKDFNIKQNQAENWLQYDDIHNEDVFDIDHVKDTYAIGGVDLSSTTDLTCATLIVMKEGDDKKYVLQQYFMAEEELSKRQAEDKAPYAKWAEKGFLTACPGTKVDYSMVTAWFVKMRDEFDIFPYAIGYDPWNSSYWIDEMSQNGFTMHKVRQGAQTLSQPMKELGADLKAKHINYNRNPMLEWCLLNTAVKRDLNDNIQPSKSKNKRQRIDGAVSLLIAYTTLFEQFSDYKNLI